MATKLKVLSIPVVSKKSRYKVPKTVHAFHRFIFELNDCLPVPVPRKITRRFSLQSDA